MEIPLEVARMMERPYFRGRYEATPRPPFLRSRITGRFASFTRAKAGYTNWWRNQQARGLHMLMSDINLSEIRESLKTAEGQLDLNRWGEERGVYNPETERWESP